MSKLKIYALFPLSDPNDIRYVGQTIKPVRARFQEHKRQSEYRIKHSPVYAWIRKHNRKIGFVVLQNNADPTKDEKLWMETLDFCGYRLLNVVEGSEPGTLGFRHSDETKLSMSAKAIGRKHSRETRIKMMSSHFGRRQAPHSEETKEKIRHSLTGKKDSPETRKKKSEAQIRRQDKIRRGGYYV